MVNLNAISQKIFLIEISKYLLKPTTVKVFRAQPYK